MICEHCGKENVTTAYPCWNCGQVSSGSGPAPCSAPRPKIVTICGSSRFVDVSSVKAWELNKQGIATFMMPLLPQWYPGVQEHHQAEAEGVAANLDNLWLRLIEMSDEIFVVNCDGYIGQRTRIEVNHALSIGKPVRYLEQNAAMSEVADKRRPD